MKKFKIYNGKVITPYKVINDGCVIIEGQKISYVGNENIQSDDFVEIDAKGLYISPGFIDIHTHGGGDADFMDGTVEAYIKASECHAQHGTTSIIPTTLSSSNEELKNTFSVFKAAKNSDHNGADFVGFHLEGPYFSMEQKGAQDPRYIKDPTIEEAEEILSWTDDIIRWSMAPELKGAMAVGRMLTQRGILPAIAHSNAVYSEVQEAFENGFTHVTHLYSGMSMVRRINAYRYAGVVESAYLIDDMTVEIIADGSHLPASLLKLIYKIKGPSHIALITDSMRGAGMPEGKSILGSLKNGMEVVIEDGVAKLLDRTAFAGSVATADRLVRNMIQLADVPLTDAVRMMTSTPARIMNIDKEKGSLLPGKDADIVIFDGNINVQFTMVKGKIVKNAIGSKG
ncbi:MAG: N-acetylglucosamine-6-phosphate deacetylase [Clostridia bacterium]|jgi:N-acetylglucosamine-6-phosphate deacetylase|nr:N-acetylglucosamine-6-phosphate deacetylase [Clostridiaceae bacterium]